VGIDGIFVEVHEDPDSAPSDGPNMITPEAFDRLLADVVKVRDALAESGSFRRA
jgi:2-dehydro-3-deoxyphosphooctonate aldolase (KDO 8-P synthase)